MTTTIQPPPDGRPAKPGTDIPWKIIFRLVRWSTYISAAITLALVLHKTPPPDVSVTPQAAARVDEKFQAVAQAVANGQPAVMHMDETELNSYLASHLELAGKASRMQAAPAAPGPDVGVGAAPGTPSSAPEASLTGSQNSGAPTVEDIDQMRCNVKDVKVQLVGDRVKAYVVFDVHGKDMTLQLEGKLAAENGYFRFEPVSGQIGALPIPQSALENAMRRVMESPENREKLRLPSDISSLKIENGEVVTTYK